MRLRGAELQQRRRLLFQQEPLCRACRQQERVSPATVRDHIIPLGEGGTEDESNAQPLCQDCHDAKTKEEARRGRRRAAVSTPSTATTSWLKARRAATITGRPEC